MREAKNTSWLKLTGPLFLTVLIVLVGVSAYEVVNNLFFPEFTLLGIHVGAVGFSALTAAITAFFILRRYQKLLRKTAHETEERLRAEEALRENEELYETVIENVADGITIVVGTERVFVNRAFLSIHGLKDPVEVVGQPLDRFILPEDREVVRERVLARQRGESLGRIAEYRIQRPDGRIRTVQVSVETIGYKGRPATVAVLRDVTEIKEAEKRIRDLNRELEEHVHDLEIANSDLKAFNSMVSHDLRVPLIAIQGFSRRLAESCGIAFEGKGKDYLVLIQNSAERMAKLINDLLSYSRLGKQAVQSGIINMRALVESVIADLKETYPGGEVTVFELPESLGDEGMIRQVVTNLLSNAFKFTGHREKRIIEVRGWGTDEENVYSVRDNGAGFDMAHQDKLFDIFRRLHGSDEFEGTGIGLAIVKRVIGLHGGRVWAEGKPDEGATFYFTLPGKN